MSKPIRVLHILQRMEAAGVQTLLMSLYRNMDREKIQFDFLVHYKEHQFFDDEIKALGGRIYRLSVREDYNFIKYIMELNSFFRTHPEYKIVHGHMHSLGAIYLHCAKKNGVPVRIAHSHTNSTQNDIKKYIKQIMNKMYKYNATDLFACSELAGKYMFGTDQFQVINNAIIAKKFIFNSEIREGKRKELGVEDKIVIGNVGRFEIQKNQQFTVRLFHEFHKRHPNSVLLLIGTGSMEDNIHSLVEKLSLNESVLFLGNRKDVSELYMAMDVFLLPSLFEGLGIVGVEAQASGTPVVCTDTLPKELNVTNLISRVSLTANYDTWIEMIEKALNNPNTHKNMIQDIIAADYDMCDVSNKLQQFYLEKYDEITH